MNDRKFIIKGSIEIFNKICNRPPKKVDFSGPDYFLDRIEFQPLNDVMILHYKCWHIMKYQNITLYENRP